MSGAFALTSTRSFRRSPGATLLMGFIRGYRLVFASRPSPCRFEPTCSAYGLKAVELHGFFRGSWLIARRIGRCRPGGGSGYDPVPHETGDAVRQTPHQVGASRDTNGPISTTRDVPTREFPSTD